MKELQKYGFLRFVCVLENHRDRTNDTLNQRTVPCTHTHEVAIVEIE